jgi:uncharacterized protein (TIGR02145 family)
LLPGTRYYFRAYATNSIGTAYGSEVTATTLAALPTLSTSIISAIATTTATGGGAIISDGGSPVTARGVCWSTAQSPTISNSKTTDGTGSGSFTSLVAGLTPATTYYVRAYATNTIGTAYGNQVSFSTYSVPTLATITTSTPTKITSTEATIGGNLLSEGNASVTEKGVCISLTANPTTASWKYPNGTVTGTGVFSSYFTGFTPNTTYYVRAYAINIVGTAYGNEVSFKTLQPTGITVSDIEGNMYRTVTIGTQVWMVDNLKTTHYNNGTVIPNITADATWIALTSAAYCWYNNDLSNKTTYGALYNWYAVTTGRLCPTGWHVPSDAEFTTLTNYLGGGAIAWGKIKEAGTLHWYTPNTGATNSSGFTALPGGGRSTNGLFEDMGEWGYYWSATESSTTNAWELDLSYDNNLDYSGRFNYSKHYGNSVRCLKD